MKQKILVSISLIVIIYAGWRVWAVATTGGDYIPGMNAMDVETGEHFTFQTGPDFPGWPAPNHKTGKNTVYPVEVCYFNQCGKKPGGTWVILNGSLDKPGPTTCPVCGHTVTLHNPLPEGFTLDEKGKLIAVPNAKVNNSSQEEAGTEPSGGPHRRSVPPGS